MDADSQMIVCRPVIQVADKAPLTLWRRRSGSVNPACRGAARAGPARAARPQHRPELPEGLGAPGGVSRLLGALHPRRPWILATAPVRCTSWQAHGQKPSAAGSMAAAGEDEEHPVCPGPRTCPCTLCCRHGGCNGQNPKRVSPRPRGIRRVPPVLPSTFFLSRLRGGRNVCLQEAGLWLSPPAAGEPVSVRGFILRSCALPKKY